MLLIVYYPPLYIIIWFGAVWALIPLSILIVNSLCSYLPFDWLESRWECGSLVDICAMSDSSKQLLSSPWSKFISVFSPTCYLTVEYSFAGHFFYLSIIICGYPSLRLSLGSRLNWRLNSSIGNLCAFIYLK